jgi:hypothetical protein
MEQIIGNKEVFQSTDVLNESAYVYSGYSSNDHNMQCRTKYDVYTDYWQKNTRCGVGAKCYNTGKVLIGCHYQPPPLREYSAHAERLQTALLTKRESRATAAADLALYVVAVLAIVTIAFTL